MLETINWRGIQYFHSIITRVLLNLLESHCLLKIDEFQEIISKENLFSISSISPITTFQKSRSSGLGKIWTRTPHSQEACTNSIHISTKPNQLPTDHFHPQKISMQTHVLVSLFHCTTSVKKLIKGWQEFPNPTIDEGVTNYCGFTFLPPIHIKFLRSMPKLKLTIT